MRIKLDENLGKTIARLLRDAGHDVETVVSQSLCGVSDRNLIQVCKQERRCLVTLDMDFANPLVFKPSDYSGIAVLRLTGRATTEELQALATTLIKGLQREPIEGRLWIVQRNRIRVYQQEGDAQ
ncbi:MAG: DUF5615 family PIN-like protein [Armatimonadota bacterium]|nr:DUF5615 family PIN-like protein [Armatimonadota bacterium]